MELKIGNKVTLKYRKVLSWPMRIVVWYNLLWLFLILGSSIYFVAVKHPLYAFPLIIFAYLNWLYLILAWVEKEKIGYSSNLSVHGSALFISAATIILKYYIAIPWLIANILIIYILMRKDIHEEFKKKKKHKSYNEYFID